MAGGMPPSRRREVEAKTEQVFTPQPSPEDTYGTLIEMATKQRDWNGVRYYFELLGRWFEVQEKANALAQ